jgi:hypothetical protein
LGHKSKLSLNENDPMEEIQDSGKVWCKGFVGPAHALRIENKIFATGKSKDQTIECWVDEGVLCVDLNDPKLENRVAKKFPLDLEPTLSGTLFNGFTRTKHADVLIVSPNQDRIEEEVISGETYRVGQYDSMCSRDFWGKVWG